MKRRRRRREESGEEEGGKESGEEERGEEGEKVDEEKKEELERTDWSEFTLRKIIEEGVCGGKVPCILVEYKGKRYILKEMKKSMNFGKDYLVVDRCKSVFGLRDMNMKRIRSNRLW